MDTRILVNSETLDWKQAYMAVVLEKDYLRLSRLIEEAREKLASRLGELTAAGSFPVTRSMRSTMLSICSTLCGAACCIGMTLSPGPAMLRMQLECGLV
jgi:hypothetical protein